VARLTASRDAGRTVVDGAERRSVEALAKVVVMLTAGFADLVGALDEGATISVDAA